MIKDLKFPVLLYHNIETGNETFDQVPLQDSVYTISERLFEDQIKYLAHNNFISLTLEELLKVGNSGYDEKDKLVIITFDDGHISNYLKAYPILKKYKMKGVFFITVGKIGQSNMLNWGQIGEMLLGGMEIGSHTLTHPYPTECSRQRLKYELEHSKFLLEESLNKEIVSFSSPTGFYNPEVETIAKEAGYKIVCFGSIGFNKLTDSYHSLKRICIKKGQRFNNFVAFVNCEVKTLLYFRFKQMLRNFLKKICGVRVYNFLRRKLNS